MSLLRDSPFPNRRIFHSTPPTLVDLGLADEEVDSRGNRRVTLLGNNTSVAIGNATAIDALANQYGLSVLALAMFWNGASWDRGRGANVIKSLVDVAVVAGTGVTIWTPAGGKKFRLMGWVLSMSAAGQLIFGDNTVGAVFARSEKLPAAGVSQPPNGFGNGFLSAVANNVLKVDVSIAANVGGLVFGTEE